MFTVATFQLYVVVVAVVVAVVAVVVMYPTVAIVAMILRAAVTEDVLQIPGGDADKWWS